MSKVIKEFNAGTLASQMSESDIETALLTLAEVHAAGHEADLSLRQQEVAEVTYKLWVDAEDD